MALHGTNDWESHSSDWECTQPHRCGGLRIPHVSGPEFPLEIAAPESVTKISRARFRRSTEIRLMLKRAGCAGFVEEASISTFLMSTAYGSTDGLGESGEWMNFFCSAAAVPYLAGNVTVSAFQ